MVGIPGLIYISNYISPATAKSLLEIIDQQPWLNELKRRVQHYGYRYDYKKRAARSLTRALDLDLENRNHPIVIGTVLSVTQ